MATFTKAGLGELGRALTIYLKSGGGIAGNTTSTISSKTGSGIRGLVGQAPDTDVHIEVGAGIRSSVVSATRESSAASVPTVQLAATVFPSTNAFPSTTSYPGQGVAPIVRCRLSFSNVTGTADLTGFSTPPPIPTWVEVANSKLRSFSVSRGRGSELEEFAAGSATVELDNRDRAYDPNVNASVRPYNRIWLYVEFAGEIHDIFFGYVESWTQGWPGVGFSDAVVTASAVDELAVLALQALPVTTPPFSSNQDLVMSDGPVAFWDFNEDPAMRAHIPSVETPYQQTPPGLRTAEESLRTDRRRPRVRQPRKHI